jgi:hypothetical protein
MDEQHLEQSRLLQSLDLQHDNEDKNTTSPAPFTQDETFTQKIGGTTYILTAKYKQGAKEGLVDKLLRLIANGDDVNYQKL